MNDEEWVNERLKALDGDRQWHPNAPAALAGLQRRDARRRIWQRGWIWSASMASVCAVALLALPSPAKCALVGVGCRTPLKASVLLAPAVAQKASNDVAHYKVSGSPAAPVVVEIYSDYECPACAFFYTNVFPQFAAEYVKTGKVRLVHRDFPLPQHPYSKLAASYANAAGELGYYDAAVNRLFSDQQEWSATGNVDAALAQVLPPGTMQKVRELVKSDPGLDETVSNDLAIVAREGIHQTPTIVFIRNGVRRTVNGPPTLSLLKSFLDEMLAQ